MPIYMKYNNIPGDATAEGHEKWIELNSFQWGVGRGISSPTGASADRESSAPSISEIVVTKHTDVASPKLLDESLQGEGQKVTIDFCKTDKVRLLPFLTGAQTSGNPLFNSAETSAHGSSPWVFETPRCGAGVSKKRGCPFSQDFLAFRSPEKGKSRTKASLKFT